MSKVDSLAILPGNGERGIELPSFRQLKRRFESNCRGRRAGRIEQYFMPHEDQKLGRSGCAEVDSGSWGRQQKIQIYVNGICADGNVDMKCIHIDVVLFPGKIFSLPGEFQSGQIRNGTVGGMISGQPLWVIQSKRSRRRGYVKLRVQHFLRCVGCIHGYGDWPRPSRLRPGG